MSNFFDVLKGLVFETNQNDTQENQVIKHCNIPEMQGICARCHKMAKLKNYGLCNGCFNARNELVKAANPEIYNQNTYIGINQNLDRLLQYDFNKLDIESAEIVEQLNGVEKAFLLYCDFKSIDDFKIAMYWFYQYFIDCNYLISKFIKNGYLEIKYSTDFSKLTSDILKEALKQVNLKVSGTKSELVKRIEENFTDEQINNLAQNQGKKFIVTEKGLQEIGEYKPILAHDVDFENNCYDLILENKLNEAYKMMCQYEHNKLIRRGLNCDWKNPPEKKFRINLDKNLPFNLPNCMKPYEKDVKATTIYTNIMGSNPRNSVPFFCQRINADFNRRILEKAFIFLSAYESGAKGLDYSDIENLEQEQIRIDNAPKEIFENLSIDKFIEELKNKIIQAGLDIRKLEYDVLKDGTSNFTYHIGDWNSQIGRIVFGKKKSSMQILTQDTVKWLDNLPMEEYINNIDKWILYIKEVEKQYNEL